MEPQGIGVRKVFGNRLPQSPTPFFSEWELLKVVFLGVKITIRCGACLLQMWVWSVQVRLEQMTYLCLGQVTDLCANLK